MSATNSTGRANHLLLMSSASRNAVIDFDVPPTASHKNNSAKFGPRKRRSVDQNPQSLVRLKTMGHSPLRDYKGENHS